jgi:hypothetical protein
VLSISESAGCTMPAGRFRGWAHCPLQAQDARHTRRHCTRHALSARFLSFAHLFLGVTFMFLIFFFFFFLEKKTRLSVISHE